MFGAFQVAAAFFPDDFERSGFELEFSYGDLEWKTRAVAYGGGESSRLITGGPGREVGRGEGGLNGSSSMTYWCRSPIFSRCRNLSSIFAESGRAPPYLVTPSETSRARCAASGLRVRTTMNSVCGSLGSARWIWKGTHL